jgi:hypothetical protein
MLGHLITLLQSSIDKGEIQSSDPRSSAEMFASLVFGRIDIFLRYGEKFNLTAEDRRERAERAVDAWMLIHQK